MCSCVCWKLCEKMSRLWRVLVCEYIRVKSLILITRLYQVFYTPFCHFRGYQIASSSRNGTSFLCVRTCIIYFMKNPFNTVRILALLSEYPRKENVHQTPVTSRPAIEPVAFQYPEELARLEPSEWATCWKKRC